MSLDPTLRSFVFYAANLRGLPKGLATAVIKQHGGWRSFKEDAIDFATYGVDGGYSGFIWTSETVEFAKKYRKLIANLAESQLAELSEAFQRPWHDDFDLIEGIRNFNCFKHDCPSRDDVIACLYGDGDDTSVMNALAWYAAEEVLRAYADFVEEQGGDNE